MADEGGKSYKTGVAGVLLGDGMHLPEGCPLQLPVSEPPPPVVLHLFRSRSGDVNGDGRPDLVVVDWCFSDCSDGGVGVLLNKTPRAITTTTVAPIVAPQPIAGGGQTVTFTATVSSTSHRFRTDRSLRSRHRQDEAGNG